MSEDSGGRRLRRSTRVSQRRKQARQRFTEQLAEERDRKRRIERELDHYSSVVEKIADVETEANRRIAGYEQQIRQVQADVEAKTAGLRAEAAVAALRIHEAGRTVEQLAALLTLPSARDARALIRAGRMTAADDSDAHAGLADQPKPGQPDTAGTDGA